MVRLTAEDERELARRLAEDEMLVALELSHLPIDRRKVEHKRRMGPFLIGDKARRRILLYKAKMTFDEREWFETYFDEEGQMELQYE